MSRYAYDYSLNPARPTRWGSTLTSIIVVGTVMAVSATSGALVTLQLLASPRDVVLPHVAAAIPPAPQQVTRRVVALTASVPAAPSYRVELPTAAGPPTPQSPPPPTVTASVRPAPVTVAPAAQPAPIPDSELTFAKGYAQRRAIANGAVIRHGKVLVAAKAQLGRAAVKSKPRVYARNNANGTNSQDRRGVETARGDAFGMFQRFDRPDQFDFARHQALAFGDQRTPRRRSDAPPARPPGPFGNSPSGLFGGLF